MNVLDFPTVTELYNDYKWSLKLKNGQTELRDVQERLGIW
jgi:hypothetical protein